MDKEIENFIGSLEDQGIVEWYGVADGEALFRVNMLKLKEAVPELYESMVSDILLEMDEALLSLWQKGLIEVEFDENNEPKFRATQEGIDYLDTDSE